MKHMSNDERNLIEFMPGCGRNITEIAKALGRSQSTISREVLNRRIESESIMSARTGFAHTSTNAT